MSTRPALLLAVCLCLLAAPGRAAQAGAASASAPQQQTPSGQQAAPASPQQAQPGKAAAATPQPGAPAKPTPPPPPPLPVEVLTPEVIIPASMLIAPPETLKASFPQGFTPGMGFGLCPMQVQPDGALILHTLSGRGATLAGPGLAHEGRPTVSTLFVLPGYTPAIVILKLAGPRAEVMGTLPLKTEEGQPMRGLPPAPGKGGQAEIPLSLALERLPFDPHGLDPQGLAHDHKRGAYWLADGYRPALARVSPRDGRVLALIEPGEDLEPYLATRRAGFGFSGASLSPTGRIYTMMRGPLFWDGKPAIVSRIVEYDPDTERVRQLPYPIELDIFADLATVNTGEIVAFADKRVLVLEQGLDKEGKPRSLVFMADLTQAHNVSRVFNEAGQPCEALTELAQWRKADLRMAKKTLILDLHAAGFKAARAESMALMADGRTLAFMSGHGFGLEGQIADFARDASGAPVLAPSAYALEPGGRLSYQGKPAGAAIGIRPTRETPKLWLAVLPRKVSDY